MSTDFRPLTPICMADLFDGRPLIECQALTGGFLVVV
jgi:hypothetical protein